jgi:DNA-binding CsgD family transcriptional regulator
VNLVDAGLVRAVKRRASVLGLDVEEAMPGTLACALCHDVNNVSRAGRDGWNLLVAYLSGGLLYGWEVERPEGFAARKREFRSPSFRDAPRRGQVLRRLLNGWTVMRIARDLMMTCDTVWQHLAAIYRREGVKDRHELAKKLGSRHAQPLNQEERARERRGRVMEMLVEGKSRREIMAALSLDEWTINRDTRVIYGEHGVRGFGKQCARRLVEKLGRGVAEPQMKSDEVRRGEPRMDANGRE